MKPALVGVLAVVIFALGWFFGAQHIWQGGGQEQALGTPKISEQAQLQESVNVIAQKQEQGNVIDDADIENAVMSEGEKEPTKLERSEMFGTLVSDIHKNLHKGTDEAIKVLNFGIDDAVYVTTRVKDEVVKYNIEKYKVDRKTGELWLKIKDNENVSRWQKVLIAGHEKLLAFLENKLGSEQ